MSLSQHIPNAHKAAGRSLCYALTCNDSEAFQKLTVIFSLRLTPAERAGVCYAAMASLPQEIREDVFLLCEVHR